MAGSRREQRDAEQKSSRGSETDGTGRVSRQQQLRGPAEELFRNRPRARPGSGETSWCVHCLLGCETAIQDTTSATTGDISEFEFEFELNLKPK